MVEPKSRAGKRVVKIPAGLVPLPIAHRASPNGSNPLNLVFPSQTGTPLYPKNVLRRHFLPALQTLGIVGVRQHDFRRSVASLHVAAGTHPKLAQERVGHSSINFTMGTYAGVAGQMALATKQEARFEALTAKALAASVPVEPTPKSGVEATADVGEAPGRVAESESTT